MATTTQTNNILNVCDSTKQITTSFWNGNIITDDERIKYIKYKQVKKITPPAEVQYYDNKDAGEGGDETFIFTNYDQFRTAIKTNPVILDKVVKHMENINFTKDELVMPKKSGGNRSGPQVKNSVSQQKLHSKSHLEMCVGVKMDGVRCIWKKQKDSCYCSRHN